MARHCLGYARKAQVYRTMNMCVFIKSLHSNIASEIQSWSLRLFVPVFSNHTNQYSPILVEFSGVTSQRATRFVYVMFVVRHQRCLLNSKFYIGVNFKVSRVAEYSVWIRAGRAGDRGSIPGRGARIFCCSLCVQTSSWAHPVSCKMDTVCPFPGAKTRPGRALTTHSHLLPRSRMSRSYTSLYKHFHDV
jgi:hypothetical protein